MENPTNQSHDQSRPIVPTRTDGFFGVLEHLVQKDFDMDRDPDLTGFFTTGKVPTLPAEERQALIQYAIDQGYVTTEQIKAMMAPVEAPAAENTTEQFKQANPKTEAAKATESVTLSTEHRSEQLAGNDRDERFNLNERLEALQEGGYQLTHADVAARMDRRHNRIFVGYGVKRSRDGRVLIGEAFAKRTGDGYETPLRDSSIVIPESVADRWANDAAFRSEIIRRCVDMRDELEGEERNGRYRGGTALIFDGIKDGQFMDDVDAVRRDPSLLKPKWKYRLDNRNHYDAVSIEEISPKILEAVIEDPHNYHQRPRGESTPEKQAAWQRWNTWFGKELQRKREQIISRELEREFAPAGKTVAAERSEQMPQAEASQESAKAVIPTPEAVQTAEARPVAEAADAKPWDLDEIYDIARIRVSELGRLFENPRDVPMFVKVARDVLTAQLLEAGRRAQNQRKIASQIDVLGALSHAFGDYYIEKGEDDAGRTEAQEIILNELIDEIREEAFGESNGQESEKERKIRQEITDYLILKYLEVDDRRGGFNFNGADTLKRRVKLMREKLGE